jgi:hypothetical protein
MRRTLATSSCAAVAALALSVPPAVTADAGAPAGVSSVKLGLRAAVLHKTGDKTWTGDVQSPQLGGGTITVTGTVAFLSQESENPTPHTLRFDASFKKGHLRGCLRNRVYLRPGNRQVWDGTGRVTSTSPKVARYRGVKLGEGGVSPADDLTVAKPFRIDALRANDPRGGQC